MTLNSNFCDENVSRSFPNIYDFMKIFVIVTRGQTRGIFVDIYHLKIYSRTIYFKNTP